MRLPNLSALAGTAIVVSMFVAAPAHAWDSYGHRLIARLALEGMSKRLGGDAPAWLNDKDMTGAIVDNATTPDRWRSVKVAQLTHLNNPDHYIDAEELADFGMTLETMPRLRHEFVRQLEIAREKPDFKGPPINDKLDPSHVREYPGTLPFATCETYAKVVSAMQVYRIIDKLNDPGRRAQLEGAKAAITFNMGVLAHYVGDGAQPLHTTIHHHGWVGENPNGYTTDRKFHAWIDGGVVKLHNITIADVRSVCAWHDKADANEPWEDVIAHIKRSFDEVEPLYKLEKSGALKKAPGKEFIISRLADGADMLSALYADAWKAAEPTEKDVQDFVRYDNWQPE
ncbi:MAG: hypothetical protein GC200_05190 [Tepidisphaera sp.]|nr:hypothetical protein [Tepidisphaera sp.]